MIISIGFNRTTIINKSNRDHIYDYLQNWYSLILTLDMAILIYEIHIYLQQKPYGLNSFVKLATGRTVTVVARD